MSLPIHNPLGAADHRYQIGTRWTRRDLDKSAVAVRLGNMILQYVCFHFPCIDHPNGVFWLDALAVSFCIMCFCISLPYIFGTVTISLSLSSAMIRQLLRLLDAPLPSRPEKKHVSENQNNKHLWAGS